MAFHGKIALITGGASGIGKVMAERLIQQGATVVLLDVNEKALQEMAIRSEKVKVFKCKFHANNS